MRATKGRIAKTGSYPDDHYRNVVIAEIYSDLLETTIRYEGCDCICHWLQPAHGHACRGADHVGFGYTAIEKTLRCCLLVAIKQLIADVTREKYDVFVVLGNSCDF